MLKISKFILLAFFISCLQKRVQEIDNSTCVTIDSINDIPDEKYLFINAFLCNKKHKIIIVSQKETCDSVFNNTIRMGQKYYVNIKKQYKIEINGVNYNLYTDNIYIDGKILFPKVIQVFSSPSIIGKCLNN